MDYQKRLEHWAASILNPLKDFPSHADKLAKGLDDGVKSFKDATDELLGPTTTMNAFAGEAANELHTAVDHFTKDLKRLQNAEIIDFINNKCKDAGDTIESDFGNTTITSETMLERFLDRVPAISAAQHGLCAIPKDLTINTYNAHVDNPDDLEASQAYFTLENLSSLVSNQFSVTIDAWHRALKNIHYEHLITLEEGWGAAKHIFDAGHAGSDLRKFILELHDKLLDESPSGKELSHDSMLALLAALLDFFSGDKHDSLTLQHQLAAELGLVALTKNPLANTLLLATELDHLGNEADVWSQQRFAQHFEDGSSTDKLLARELEVPAGNIERANTDLDPEKVLESTIGALDGTGHWGDAGGAAGNFLTALPRITIWDFTSSAEQAVVALPLSSQTQLDIVHRINNVTSQFVGSGLGVQWPIVNP